MVMGLGEIGRVGLWSCVYVWFRIDGRGASSLLQILWFVPCIHQTVVDRVERCRVFAVVVRSCYLFKMDTVAIADTICASTVVN